MFRREFLFFYLLILMSLQVQVRYMMITQRPRYFFQLEWWYFLTLGHNEIQVSKIRPPNCLINEHE